MNTQAEILHWICTRTQYYKAKEALKNYTYTESTPDPRDPRTSPEFQEVFDSFEIPLLSFDAPGDHARYSVASGPARLFLRDVVGPPHEDTFPFLQLPAELRERIYEMVFSYPDIAVSMNKNARLCVSWRKHKQEVSRSESTLYGPRLSAGLALLSANKEIYGEALPYFYRVNHFELACNSNLIAFVRGIASRKLKHLRHFSFCYFNNNAIDHAELSQALTTLAEHSDVKSVEIVLSDWHWFESGSSDFFSRAPETTYSVPASLPAMAELLKLVTTAESVTFNCDAPRIYEYVTENVKATSLALHRNY